MITLGWGELLVAGLAPVVTTSAIFHTPSMGEVPCGNARPGTRRKRLSNATRFVIHIPFEGRRIRLLYVQCGRSATSVSESVARQMRRRFRRESCVQHALDGMRHRE